MQGRNGRWQINPAQPLTGWPTVEWIRVVSGLLSETLEGMTEGTPLSSFILSARRAEH